jgi:SAM-dependent methyltransferase
VGVDGSARAIDRARRGQSRLGLANVDFLHADFVSAAAVLQPPFDFVIAHGVFSWVAEDQRDALLDLCGRCLRPGGLLYLNYNAHPGWKVRGMVRDFLIARTAGARGLLDRARQAQDVSAAMAASLGAREHPYSQLLAREFRFVCDNDVSYIAHEYLAPHNFPYWRSHVMALLQRYGFEYLADADFNYPSGRLPEESVNGLLMHDTAAAGGEDAMDFLSYRQLHSPIFGRTPLTRRPISHGDFADLQIASRLMPASPRGEAPVMFRHPNGYEVDVRDPQIDAGLRRLAPLWPEGVRVGDVFCDVSSVMEDVTLLHRHGLVELRCVGAIEPARAAEPLRALECERGGYFTSPYHVRQAADAPPAR